MGTKHFTPKQKLVILKSASEIGVEKAAKLGGVATSTLYEWKRKLDKVGEDAILAYKPRSASQLGELYLCELNRIFSHQQTHTIINI